MVICHQGSVESSDGEEWSLGIWTAMGSSDGHYWLETVSDISSVNSSLWIVVLHQGRTVLCDPRLRAFDPPLRLCYRQNWRLRLCKGLRLLFPRGWLLVLFSLAVSNRSCFFTWCPELSLFKTGTVPQHLLNLACSIFQGASPWKVRFTPMSLIGPFFNSMSDWTI